MLPSWLILSLLSPSSSSNKNSIGERERESETMSGDTWMMARAKEELKSLEAQHPLRFDYLKLELQSLISDYDLNPSSSSSAGTQVSSNRKRTGGGELCDRDLGLGLGLEKRRKMKWSSDDRAEMALERAKACLRRIRLVKESFLQ